MKVAHAAATVMLAVASMVASCSDASPQEQTSGSVTLPTCGNGQLDVGESLQCGDCRCESSWLPGGQRDWSFACPAAP